MITYLNLWTGYNLAPWQWAAVCIFAITIGLTKTGIIGLTIAMIPVTAIIFGARESTGISLPMLIFGDFLAVLYYRRSADLKCIWRLLPWTIIGFALAILVAHLVPLRSFRYLIGISLLGSLIIMLWNEFKPQQNTNNAFNEENSNSNNRREFSLLQFLKQAVFGSAGGFASMVGNAAGPIMSVYLLSMKLPKLDFVGTTAWFFLIINVLKIPLQAFVWNNITFEGLKLGALMVPVIVFGTILGIYLVKKMPEKFYRYLVIALTIGTTILLFL